MTRALVVEDDHVLRRGLAGALRRAGYSVHDVATAEGALRALDSLRYQIVLLDLGLPDRDGLVLLPQIRARTEAAILVVSARRDQSDKVAALDLGADDYITKPFGLPELLARIRAIGRRSTAVGAVVTTHLQIDLDRAAVSDTNGRDIALTATEWAVLEVLARRGGSLVSTKELHEAVWGESTPGQFTNVRVYVNALRRKLEPDPAHPCCIRSQTGRGYWLATV